MSVKSLAGAKFGRLTVVERAPRPAGSTASGAWWLLRCDCGRTVVRRGSVIRRSTADACEWCLRSRNATKHGMHGTPEYKAWSAMIQRCTNPNEDEWPNYGGRGITVCPEWRASFEAFFADVGPRPSSLHSIDRKNNDGNYEPGNVRWAPPGVQDNNKRPNRVVVIDGVSKTMREWERTAGLAKNVLRTRLDNGWPVDASILAPADPRRPKHRRHATVAGASVKA